jgi:hypothetical protein
MKTPPDPTLQLQQQAGPPPFEARLRERLRGTVD